MFQPSRLRRAISFLVVISTLLLNYQAFAHAHFDKNVSSQLGQNIASTSDKLADVTDIFGLETGQNSCHIVSHLIGALPDNEENRCATPTVVPLRLVDNLRGLSDIPSPPPPKH